LHDLASELDFVWHRQAVQTEFDLIHAIFFRGFTTLGRIISAPIWGARFQHRLRG
jgi:hypothetical protein